MDKVKRARRSLRASITKTIHELEAELADVAPDLVILQIKLERLTEILTEVMESDQKVLDMMLDDAAVTDAEYDAEREVIEDYRHKIKRISKKVELVLHPGRNNSPLSPGGSHVSSNTSRTDKKKNYKLPKIQIKEFSGEIKDWLGFWAQFVKIHEDEDLHESDKFQYLTQSMVTGTRAQELVDSYPQTQENYPKVIDALKDRFGRPKLLMQVYVRELQKIVLHNYATKEKINLSQMYDKLESHLRALESLGVTSDQIAVFIYPMVESSLPEDLLIAWQRSPINGSDPKKSELEQLMQFLKKEVEYEDQRSIVKNGLDTEKEKNHHRGHRHQSQQSNRSNVSTASGLFSGQTNSCIFCDKTNHQSHDCRKAPNLPLQIKRDKIREKKACYNCFKIGHRYDKCKTTVKCSLCSKKHNLAMCPEHPSNKKTDVHVESKSGNESQTHQVLANQTCTRQVLLDTLLVRVISNQSSKVARVVFDSGSQRSYINKELARQLKMTATGHEWIQQSLFGGKLTESKKHTRFTPTLESLDGRRSKTLEVVDEPIICGGIPYLPRGPWIEELAEHNIKLSDLWAENTNVDVLIGNDYKGQCLTGRILQLKCGLTAQETIFGWTLGGKLPFDGSTSPVAMTVITMMTQCEESSVRDLWNLESIGISDPVDHMSKKEKESAAKIHFLNTVSRDHDGRYSVNLPWIGEKEEIPSNRFAAEKRLLNATRKLQEAGKYELYDNIFKAWEKEGIINEVNVDLSKPCHYLPHRPVFKPDSLTTPVRPVFDASCKIGRSPSLNDCLEKGPNLLEEIPAILLRFRLKKIGVISDIRKAFLMIQVKEEERDFLRFLWWEDESCKSMKVYQHNRVVFGVTCSPFLLGAVIEHHLQQVPENERKIAQQLLHSLYVDNCVTSVDSYEEYEEFKSATTRMMAEAKMDLCQWECSSGWETRVSPRPKLGCGLGSNRTDTSLKNWSTVLGLKWNKEDDTLSCDFEDVPLPEKLTKRKILSYAQKIYDSIGFLAPALLCPKMILQEAWATKTGWDEEVTTEIVKRFGNWAEDLDCIRDIRIPRRAACSNPQGEDPFQLHTFSDASKNAFATVVFLRSVDNNGDVTVQLLLAKSRVAPLKKITIPRLELLAGLIGTRLARVAKEALDLQEIPCIFWSDSTTALSWIRRNNEWGTFVGNRVKEICSSSNSANWRFVPGSMNPADLPSRGCTFKELLASRWWEGPAWLRRPSEDWPNENEIVNEEEVLAEKRKTTSFQMMTINKETGWYCKRNSNYRINVKILAWIMRFCDKLKKRPSHSMDELDSEEMEKAERKMVHIVQEESFGTNEDTICGLRVMRDEDGIIHVKSKLINRQDTPYFKLPILLPSKHPLVDQIIRYYHETNGHAGTQIIMGQLREKFWIIHGRKAVQNILRGCVICRRFALKSPTVAEAPLPENRVKNSRVFEITGVDLAGPLFLKNGSKTWIVLFTCAVYRAVHLELVDSQSTESFLLALSRFISRRGRPSTIYSDNGTNFVGASNLFKSIDWKKVSKYSPRGIEPIRWIFNPPSAAWWGGWWERMVRIVKDLLKRILGSKKLNQWQLQTKLCEVEVIVNSRPLTYITEDQGDLIPLTPSLFLENKPISDCPEANQSEGDGLRNKFKEMSKMTQELQQRFRREYLAQLVHKGKGRKHYGFKCGDVCLVGDDNKKRIDWPLAKIVALYPGKDGAVRACKVKTSTSFLIRPVQRLFPLEVSSDSIPQGAPEILKTINDKKENTSRQPNDEDRAVPSSPTLEKPLFTRSGRQVKRPQRF